MSRLSRRDFARAATAAAGATLLSRRAAAQSPAREPTAPDSAASAGAAKHAGAVPSEADARLAAILARWSARLTAPDRATVAALAAEWQAPLEALRAAALDINDAPAVQFHTLRKKH
jgi:hypothetical protein